MQALVDDGLELSADLQPAQNFIDRSDKLRFVVQIGCQHFQEDPTETVKHLGLDLKVLVEILLAESRELELLDVDLDAEVGDVDVSEVDVGRQVVSRFVGQVLERLQQFSGPEPEEMLVVLQPLTRLFEQLSQSFAFLDVEEVQIVIRVRHVVEANVRLEVLTPQ